MTKVSVFGEQPTEQPKELKRIEFVKWLHGFDNEYKVEFSIYNAQTWDEVCLLVKNYQNSGYDLILAQGIIDGVQRSTLYIGHWNDGVV